jgi:hypothetical protein
MRFLFHYKEVNEGESAENQLRELGYNSKLKRSRPKDAERYATLEDYS